MDLKSLNRVILFIIGCSLVVVVSVESCDVSGLVNCAHIFGSHYRADQLTNGFIPDADTLRHMCSSLDTYKTCVDTKLRFCNSKELDTAINIVKDVLNFMCGDSKEGILNNAACWNKPSLKSGNNQCMATHNQTVKNVKQQIYTKSQEWLYGQLCEAMHSVTECVSNIARNVCGTEPAHIMHKLMDATFKVPYTAVPDCSAISGTASLMYSCALCLTTLVSYILIIFL